MLALILTLVLGLFLAYFSTLNTAFISVNFFGNAVSLPLYGLVLGAMLLGIILSFVISIFNSISSAWAIRKREVKIKQEQETSEDLRRRIHDLEIENTKLKAERGEEKVEREEIVVEEHQPKRRTIPEMIRQNFLS